MKLDTKDFENALKLYSKATGKTAVDTCNRAMKNTVIKAVAITKKTEATAIQAELEKGSRVDPKTPLKYILAAKENKKLGGSKSAGGAYAKWQIREIAKRIVSKRRRTAGYLLVCIRMAGKQFGLFKNMKSPNGWGRISKGTPANKTQKTPESKILISLPEGAQKNVNLQRAINLVSSDMIAYAKRKMAEDAAKYSAK